MIPYAHVAPARADVRDLGPLRSTARVHVGILFRYRNENELRELVRLQASPASPLFKHYLSRAQWNATFAPDPANVARTIATLRREGFRISRVADNRGFALAIAPAAVVERTFSTQLRSVEVRGRIAFRNVRPAAIPNDMPGVIGVSGLDTTSPVQLPIHAVKPSPARAFAALRASASATASPKPVSTSTPLPNPSPEPTLQTAPLDIQSGTTGYGPAALAVAYDYPVMHGYAGRGRAIATVGSGDFSDSDLAAFAKNFSLDLTGTVRRVSIDDGPQSAAGQNTQANLEATLDVEASLGLAPGADFYAYETNEPFDASIEDAYNQIVSDDLVDVVSSSFTACENFDSAIEFAEGYLAMQGAAKGITFVASAGDNNGLACYVVAPEAGGMPLNLFASVGVPAADQYFTGVDGSDLVVDENTGAYVSEIGYEMSSGGVSIFEPRPDWQAATSGTNPSGRTVPDVSLDAGNATGYDVFYEGDQLPTGGTSLSSPLMAAMVAEVDEVEGTRNGWINPRLYQIFNAQSYAFAFRDITVGTDGLYTAASGYDEDSGIGSLKGWELAGEL